MPLQFQSCSSAENQVVQPLLHMWEVWGPIFGYLSGRTGSPEAACSHLHGCKYKMGPKQNKQYVCGKNRKFNMGPKQKIRAEANAEHSGGHMMNHHVVAAAGDGRPTSSSPLVFSEFASACSFCFCPTLYFLLLVYIVLNFWADLGHKSIIC